MYYRTRNLFIYFCTLIFLCFSADSASATSKDELTDYSNYNYDDLDEEVYNYESVYDPFEKFNRAIFKFNYFLLKHFAVPMGTAYNRVVNKFLRERISNFFSNLAEPVTFVNSVLQFNIFNSVKSLTTFVFNTTFGFFGFFDVVSQRSIRSKYMHFGDTLAFYHIPNGPYVVLPFFGSFYLRDASGLVADYAVNPFYINAFEIYQKGPILNSYKYKMPVLGFDFLDRSSRLKVVYDEFLKKVFDPYSFTRNFYVNKRASELKSRLGQ